MTLREKCKVIDVPLVLRKSMAARVMSSGAELRAAATVCAASARRAELRSAPRLALSKMPKRSDSEDITVDAGLAGEPEVDGQVRLGHCPRRQRIPARADLDHALAAAARPAA